MLQGDVINTSEFGTAILLYLLLTRGSNNQTDDNTLAHDAPRERSSQNLEVLWSNFNSLLESLVGYSNCLNFLQLGKHCFLFVCFSVCLYFGFFVFVCLIFCFFVFCFLFLLLLIPL